MRDVQATVMHRASKRKMKTGAGLLGPSEGEQNGKLWRPDYHKELQQVGVLVLIKQKGEAEVNELGILPADHNI